MKTKDSNYLEMKKAAELPISRNLIQRKFATISQALGHLPWVFAFSQPDCIDKILAMMQILLHGWLGESFERWYKECKQPEEKLFCSAPHSSPGAAWLEPRDFRTPWQILATSTKAGFSFVESVVKLLIEDLSQCHQDWLGLHELVVNLDLLFTLETGVN